MRTLLFSLLLTFSVAQSLTSAENEVQWLTDYNEAVAQSEETGKPIFLLFTNSYSCGPCILLEKNVLSTPEFAEFAQSEIIPLKVDFAPIYRDKNIPSSTKNLIAFRHKQNIPDDLKYRGWPYLILFNPSEAASYDGQLRGFQDLESMVDGIGLGPAN